MQKKDLNVAVGSRIRKVREHQTVPTIISLAKALRISTDYILLGIEPDGSVENVGELQALLSAIPKDKQPYATELVRVLMKALD